MTNERHDAMNPDAEEPRTVRVTVDPQQTPQEEAELVARIAAAIVAESSTAEVLQFELRTGDAVEVPGTTVADRMQGSARWSA